MTYFSSGVITAAQLEAIVPRIADRTSTQTVNGSSALVSDSQLFLAVAASTRYRLRGRILYNSNSTANFKFAFTFPTSTTLSFTVTGTAAGGSVLATFDQTDGTVSALAGAGADDSAFIDGIVTVSSTPGTLQVQWAQNTSNASNTQVKAGSYIELQQIVTT